MLLSSARASQGMSNRAIYSLCLCELQTLTADWVRSTLESHLLSPHMSPASTMPCDPWVLESSRNVLGVAPYNDGFLGQLSWCVQGPEIHAMLGPWAFSLTVTYMD